MSTLFGKSSKRKRHCQGDGQEEGDRDGPESRSKEEKNVDVAAPTTSKTSTGMFEPEPLPLWASLEDLGLAEPLVTTCRQLGFKKPTPVQRTVIPFLLKNQEAHILALAQTGSGKTAAFLLPILHTLAPDPYGIYAVILTPTRELAKQIHQQVLALGSAYQVQSALIVGGLDAVQQSLSLDQRPHFCVATPGRLAQLLQGPKPPMLQNVRYVVLDEADRLLAANSGFERHVAELLLHCTTTRTTTTTTNNSSNRTRRSQCQTLLFSATMTRSLKSIEELAGAGLGRLPLKKFVIHDTESEQAGTEVAKNLKKAKKDESDKVRKEENDSGGSNGSDEEEDSNDDEDEKEDDEDETRHVPKIPAGLKQEYVFMPSRVRDAYLMTAIRNLLIHGGRVERKPKQGSGWTAKNKNSIHNHDSDEDNKEENSQKARSAIIFVSTCERAALVSGILTQLGVENVALHSLLSQNRRLASLGKFKSQQVRVMVATDVASRGLDIPTVDLVLNSELPRNPLSYVHRVGRTARAGRRGRAISLVSEADIGLVHAAERVSGRALEKCPDVTDEQAIALLGPVTKAARLVKMKLNEIGFDELVQKFKERKQRDKKEQERIQRALKKMGGDEMSSGNHT